MVKVKKNIKKKFFEVSSPLTSAKINLYAASAEELDGRTVKLDLTRSLRGKSLELKLRVKNNKGELECEPFYVELAGSYVRRAMRNGIDYCEDSFEVECRDAIARMKPFMIARRRVSRAILAELRNSARKFLEGYVKTRTAEEIFSEIMSNKIQKQLSLKLKKIYPLALCEIRVFGILKEKGKTKVKEENLEENKEQPQT